VAAREIVEKQTKMVLGFVWQLIMRFQILAGDHANEGGGSVLRKARDKVLGWWRTQLVDYAPDITIDSSVENRFFFLSFLLRFCLLNFFLLFDVFCCCCCCWLRSIVSEMEWQF
jgi:hypothetical protein